MPELVCVRVECAPGFYGALQWAAQSCLGVPHAIHANLAAIAPIIPVSKPSFCLPPGMRSIHPHKWETSFRKLGWEPGGDALDVHEAVLEPKLGADQDAGEVEHVLYQGDAKAQQHVLPRGMAVRQPRVERSSLRSACKPMTVICCLGTKRVPFGHGGREPCG